MSRCPKIVIRIVIMKDGQPISKKLWYDIACPNLNLK